MEFEKYMNDGNNLDIVTELEQYLVETLEKRIARFDILNWWKVNYTKYPIFGQIAKDVLAMPVSIVALK